MSMRLLGGEREGGGGLGNPAGGLSGPRTLLSCRGGGGGDPVPLTRSSLRCPHPRRVWEK